MALDDTYNVTHPGQTGATGAIDAQHIEQYTGKVQSTIARKSALTGFVTMQPVRGTSVLQDFGVGESTLQKVVPGANLDGTVNKFGKQTLTVDTLVAARSHFPLLETFQTSYDSRMEVGLEHGKKIAKFNDQAFFIQALKTALKTDTTLTGLSGAGHFGGSLETMAASGDMLDPSKLYSAIANLFVKMEDKDVDPSSDDIILAVRPAQFYALLQNEQLINTNYVTANGTSVEAFLLKTYGVPVVRSNNFPGGQNITGHLLSNAANSNAYDGDFTKAVAVAFSPMALLAGETIPLTSDVHWNADYLHWVVQSYLSFGVGPRRAEMAGAIYIP